MNEQNNQQPVDTPTNVVGESDFIDRFMGWWENTNPFIGFTVLLLLALPLWIIEIWFYATQTKKGNSK